jgi:hypothetical protein
MNVGAAMGALSAAGTPLSQTAGSEVERSQREGAAHQRTADAQAKSERAAGIGETESEQQTSERDADGRRLWEAPDTKESAEEQPGEHPRQAKDTSGTCGATLDLTG